MKKSLIGMRRINKKNFQFNKSLREYALSAKAFGDNDIDRLDYAIQVKKSRETY